MKRRGFSLTETMLALAVAGAATVLMAQLLITVANQRRVQQQRQVALSEIANRLEQAATLSWDELTQERLEQTPLPPIVQGVLPEAKLTAAVTEDSGEPRSRRILIELSWTNRAGERLPPVGLSAWRFSPEGQP